MFAQKEEYIQARDALRLKTHGESVTLEEAVGWFGNHEVATLQTKFRTAKWPLIREGLEFEWIRSEKLWKRLHEHEKPDAVENRTKKVHRAAKRNVKTCNLTETKGLTDGQRAKLTVNLVVNHMVANATSGKALNDMTRDARRLVVPDMDAIRRVCSLPSE